jgi:hypothetical protein
VVSASDASTTEAVAAEPSAATAAPRPAPVVAKEINGLAIFWNLLKGWWLGLFGKRA